MRPTVLGVRNLTPTPDTRHVRRAARHRDAGRTAGKVALGLAAAAAFLLAADPARAQTPNVSKLDADLLLTPVAFLSRNQNKADLLAGNMNAAPAINAMLAAGAGFLPCGTYRLDGTVTVAHSFQGEGKECVAIVSGAASGDMLFVPGSAFDVQMTNFTLRRTAAQTGGAGIHINGARGTVVRDLDTAGTAANFNDIVLLDGKANTTIISDFNMVGASNACIHMTGAGKADLVLETHIKDGVVAGCNDGVLIENGSGLYLDNTDSLEARNSGFRFAVGSSQLFYGASMKSVYADSGRGPGFDFGCSVSDAGSCGPINHVALSGDWWAGGSGLASRKGDANLPSAGLRTINPQLNGLIMEGGIVRANGGHGIELDAGGNINIANTQVFNNNFWNVDAAYAGIFVAYSVADVTIQGCRVGPGGVDRTPLQGNASNHQRYGFIRTRPPANGTPGNLIVSGCNLTGNTLGGSAVGIAPGDNIVWSGNIPASPNQ